MNDRRIVRLASKDREPRDASDSAPVSYGVLPQLLGFHLRRSQTAVFSHFMEFVSPEESITPGLFGMLEVIAANEGLAQSELAKAMGVDRSTIVKAIDQLEARRLIARRPSSDDKRRHRLCLTPAGKAARARIRELILNHEALLVRSRLSTEEVQTLIGLLERLCQGAQPASFP
ncbi:DNA-binding MarR family transcriptional regulator [Rhodoblastus sphagnicola]|nr:MarR family transcriptional regulator [Rhodoblastus sphagnicola]MBB4199254.1 DNA-binding MarR family transcriptional regulator [Rhodoblastus sphagnicola]